MIESRFLQQMTIFFVGYFDEWYLLILSRPIHFNVMRKNLDLEQFQLENPGFNFRGANSDKKYEE